MSNYKCTIKVKKTGEIKEVYAHDDYFGKHQYGYADGEKVYREDEIEIVTIMGNDMGATVQMMTANAKAIEELQKDNDFLKDEMARLCVELDKITDVVKKMSDKLIELDEVKS